MITSSKSNQSRGEENYIALLAYFDRVGSNIPQRIDGTADIAKIVNSVPLPARGVIYQNTRNRELCNERFAVYGIPTIATKGQQVSAGATPVHRMVVDEEKQKLRQRVDVLERALLVARGEINELRSAMRRYAAIEAHVSETGQLPR